MTLDLTRVLDKLLPQRDGEAVLTLRSAVVSAVNSDGTIDITLSGVLIPDVAVIGSNVLFTVGRVCRVLVARGTLLVLGEMGTAVAGATPNVYLEFGTPSISNNSIQVLTPSNVPINDGNMYPGSGSLFTVPAGQGGLYTVGMVLRYASQVSPAGTRQARIYIDGNEYMSFQMPTSAVLANTNIIVDGTQRIPLDAGDTVQFRAFQNSGVDLALVGNSTAWIERVR